jgi:hypothetical protein
MIKKRLVLFALLLPAYFTAAAQHTTDFNQINTAIKYAFDHPGRPEWQQQTTASGQHLSGLLREMELLKAGKPVTALRNQQPAAQTQALDTLIVGLLGNDTLTITGNWTHTGPIWVYNQGVLIFDNANVIDTGDVFVFGDGQLLADSSTLFFPQQYVYERGMTVVQNGYVRIRNSSMNYSGYSHSLAVGENAVLEWNNVHQNDWTTCGLYTGGQVHINGCNLTGEFILNDSSVTSFTHADSVILWHHFPQTAVVNYSFPNGSFVNSYTFNNSTPGVSGIGYDVQVDSCSTVWWAIMPVNGSDVTISNSDIRLIGAWFERGDTTSAYGIFNNSTYSSYTAPLSDRNLQLNNSTVGTWSFYVFDSSQVAIDSCQLGEVGSMGSSLVGANNMVLDGTGGYFWASDTSFTIATNSICLPTCRSEREGVFVVAYSFMPYSPPTAVGTSTVICVQNNLVADPVPYDGSVAWLAVMEQPDTSVVNSNVTLTGSAWINQGPLGNTLDFDSYSMYYQLPSQSQNWFPISVHVTSEVSHTTLANWNTNTLQPGTYVLKLVLYANSGDSVEGFKIIELLPNPLGVSADAQTANTALMYPNPAADFVTIDLPLMPQDVTLHLYNAVGALVKTIPLSATHNILTLQELPEGIYAWRLTGAAGAGTLVIRRE